ncbi:MAG: heme-binding domain-containing protein, partial [Acidobacteria bacterium]|nr:heme-binding domain-containing protein [Acidobacteriota bacterium]
MKVWLKRIAIGAIGMFVLAQFVGPARTNPPVDRARTIHALTQITPQASAILERACRDCHSH